MTIDRRKDRCERLTSSEERYMPNRNIVFMFSGQGSHYYQMGRALFDENTAFRRIMLQLDQAAKPHLGRSIVDILYNDGRRKDELFDELQLTSVAIFVVEYALANVLISQGIKPAYLLTSSMGTYAAAAVAAVLDPKEALRAVIDLAKGCETKCRKGSMIAILGPPRLHRDLKVLREKSDIAAVNFASHFVISTADEHVSEIEATISRENIAFQRIGVSWPFHSRWIDDAREATLEILGKLRYRRPIIPLICCARSDVLDAVSPESCWDAVRNPIEFARTIAELERRGPWYYVDVGPAGTLATFLKYALPSTSTSQVYSILTPFGGELKNYQRLISEFAPQPAS
jgi:bacillaene synthase trans-acting acyltransferase